MSVVALKGDRVIRAMAAEGAVRVIAAYTRATVEEARVVHGLSRTATAALGRTLTAGAMMGTMMKGERSALSIVFTGDGPLRNITVTAKTDGSVKGYVGNPSASLPSAAGEKLKVGGIVGNGTLRIIYDVAMREPYSGLVEIQSGEIADDLAYYFTVSEQVPSAVLLGVLLGEDGAVREAGGLIVQMMPGASDELAAELEARVAAMPQLTSLFAQGKSPEAILEDLLGDKDLRILGSMPASFRCDCSHERTAKLLALMSSQELEDIASEGKDMEMTCAFCNKKYSFSPEELRQIIGTRG